MLGHLFDKFKDMGIENEARVVQISGQPGYTTAIERQKGFDDRLPEVCPSKKLSIPTRCLPCA